jgi:LPXTG-motif cell wall-anchored protein
VPSDGQPVEIPAGAALIINPDGSITPTPIVTSGASSVFAGSQAFGAELGGNRAADGGRLTLVVAGPGQGTGFGFLPGSTASIWIMSTPVRLATATVGADGTFSSDFTVPAGLSAGAHTIQLQGLDYNGESRALAAGVAAEVIGSDSALPMTGGESSRNLLFSGALLGGGALLAGIAQVKRRPKRTA